MTVDNDCDFMTMTTAVTVTVIMIRTMPGATTIVLRVLVIGYLLLFQFLDVFRFTYLFGDWFVYVLFVITNFSFLSLWLYFISNYSCPNRYSPCLWFDGCSWSSRVYFRYIVLCDIQFIEDIYLFVASLLIYCE